MSEPVKVCITCTRELPLTDFPVRSATDRRLRGQCKECRRSYVRAYSLAYKDRRKELYLENREYYQRYYRDNAAACRARQLEWRYGLPPGGWDVLFAAQLGNCYLCLEPMSDPGQSRLATDHDHNCCPGAPSCGRCIRGIAHGRCNQLIGMAYDDPARLRVIADRLEAAQKRITQRIAV